MITPDFNFEPLSPVSFLRRSDRVHADSIAVIDGERQTSYAELLTRAEKLAGALAALGDRVAIIAPNTRPLLESHFGVPMAGAVLVTLNTRYLWTLPMFHCNGWSFPWAVTAVGGTHLCLRGIDAGVIWERLYHAGVTHLNAAPTVVSMLAWHPAAVPGGLQRKVRIGTGGAPPTPALLARMKELGLDMMHLYGLTETFGPSVICDWHSEWDALPIEEQAKLKARQGVGNVISQPLRVVAEDGGDVPADGRTLGEIALRGNNLMLGYYRDDEATRKACPDGWFRTGDVGVMHPDGYVELKDRSKDVIISGGESIASVEVEQAIATHPAVLEAAVVAAPDEKWGEVPVAYVTLKEGATVGADELAGHLRTMLARYKVPKRFVFGELPKTATGKIQKFMLREKCRRM
jgi:fatty-acyl-CoA synthase